MSTENVQHFPLSPALRARIFGVALVALGLMIIIFGGLALLDVINGTVFGGLLVLALVAMLAVLLVVGPRWWIVRIDDIGYATRFIRTAGTRSARWVEVNEMAAATVAGARCVVLHLKDGSATTIPVDLVARGGQSFAEEMAAHLKSAHR